MERSFSCIRIATIFLISICNTRFLMNQCDKYLMHVKEIPFMEIITSISASFAFMSC